MLNLIQPKSHQVLLFRRAQKIFSRSRKQEKYQWSSWPHVQKSRGRLFWLVSIYFMFSYHTVSQENHQLLKIELFVVFCEYKVVNDMRSAGSRYCFSLWNFEFQVARQFESRRILKSWQHHCRTTRIVADYKAKQNLMQPESKLCNDCRSLDNYRFYKKANLWNRSTSSVFGKNKTSSRFQYSELYVNEKIWTQN